jgi:hypothetical protein
MKDVAIMGYMMADDQETASCCELLCGPKQYISIYNLRNTLRVERVRERHLEDENKYDFDEAREKEEKDRAKRF